MRYLQFAFWMVVAVFYVGFSVFHFTQIGGRLAPIEPFTAVSGISSAKSGEEPVDMWDPVRSAIANVNNRIDAMNKNNDLTNRNTGISYAAAGAIALISGFFSLATGKKTRTP